MIKDEQIRALCVTIDAESDPGELEQLLAALKMVGTQYLRERSIHLAYSNPRADVDVNKKTARISKRRNFAA